MISFQQKRIINIIQEIVLFLNFNYEFTYNANTDGLDYHYLNLQNEYGSIENDGIGKISDEIYQHKHILCPPDLLSNILLGIKSGLRYGELGYLD